MARAPLHRWTSAESDIVRREYSTGNNAELATRLGVTFGMLVYHAGSLGVRKRARCYSWTPEEDEKLRKMSETCCVATMARQLGKSTMAIYCRRRILGITRSNREWYTLDEARAILGVGYNTIMRYIANKELYATSNGDKGDTWKITPKNFKLFIRTYPESLIGRNIDIVQVITILAGINYKGVK